MPDAKWIPKLNPEKAEEIRRRYEAGERLTSLAVEHGVTVSALSRVVNGHSYRGNARVIVLLTAPEVASVQSLEARLGQPRREVMRTAVTTGLAVLTGSEQPTV